MLSLPTLASLLLLAVPSTVYADPCVTFDVDFNLLAFGFNGKDYNAGQQDSWTSGSATDITASGRPPFDGANTTCYLAQFFNAVYVLNGDKANPSDIHIYDAAKKSWTTQKVTTGNFDPSDFKTILDHDTNVFYAISHGEMYSLDLGEQTAAKSDAIAWEDVQTTPYGSDYDPVMALAQNHIHFIGVPGVPAGSVDIFVIHFSFFQPQSQSYSGATFPASHGQTASFFQQEGVQQEFAFIPDDGSMTYVINVENNSTSTLAGPSTKDPKAQYAASITALVQLDSAGGVSFIPYKQGSDSVNSAASWSTVAAIAAVAPASSSAAASGASATGASATGASAAGTAPAGTRLPASGTGSSSASATGGADAGSNGALANVASFATLASALLAAIAFLQ